MTASERFAAKIAVRESGCIEWTAAADRLGYGRFGIGKKVYLSHRVAWEWERGPIPSGLCVLHRCDNPRCVNVAHLFLGTRADNTSDMLAKGRGVNPIAAMNRSKTHCPRGHEYTPENTARDKKGRACRACRRAADRRWAAAHPEYRERRRLRARALKDRDGRLESAFAKLDEVAE
jgi:hypothetical protein